MTKACRLVFLMQVLRERACSTRDLARRCEVTPRMIRYDLLDLQSEPFYLPLIYEGRRWHVMK